jgi:S-adenosylmethionine:tRNA ribosyltransferase-isomerase
VEDFYYTLPTEAIAQQPVDPRDQSRLMVLGAGSTRHFRFHELPGLLAAGDLLVLNDTKVLPARLFARKPSGGRLEVLLLEHEGHGVWQAWLRGSRKPGIGTMLDFADGLDAEVLDRTDRTWRLRFRAAGDLDAAIERRGTMPLPPYIDRPDQGIAEDRENYQTVYARRPGAVAAPTAGLHFTRDLLAKLDRRGVHRATLTLHVGPGTFQPVQVERIEDHVMHSERFVLEPSCAAAIRDCRRRGGRVIAVGTTVVRVLEHCCLANGEVAPASGATDLFIRPGYGFRVVDALLTNFHLPRSTLLMLVSAFGGRERILAAYREAVDRRYRFYSYGDAMFVEPE